MKNMLWLLVYAFLCVELVVVCLFVLPLPRKVKLFTLRVLSTSSHLLRLGKLVNYIKISLLFAVVESSTDAYRVQQRLTDQFSSNALPGTVSLDNYTLKQRQFRSQRNFYLAGFCFTLVFVIQTLFELTSKVIMLESRLDKDVKSSSTTSADNTSHDEEPAGSRNYKKLSSQNVKGESKKIV
eukprot:jgi/Galph1/2873/GphlegSOOS_G1510.1